MFCCQANERGPTLISSQKGAGSKEHSSSCSSHDDGEEDDDDEDDGEEDDEDNEDVDEEEEVNDNQTCSSRGTFSTTHLCTSLHSCASYCVTLCRICVCVLLFISLHYKLYMYV